MREQMPRPRVMIVDDHLSLAETIADGLGETGYDTVALSSSREACERLMKEPFDALVTDLRMPELDGLSLLRISRTATPTRPVIVMTAHSAIDTAIESIRQGAFHYLTKPFKLEELELFLRRALEDSKLRSEAAALRTALRQLDRMTTMKTGTIRLNRILVAVDTSERQSGVFDAAAALALAFNASLHVVRAISVSPEFPAAAAGSTADTLPAYLKSLAVTELTELWARAPELPQTEAIVTIGPPSEVILETARDLDVDLIVIGSHGYQGWDRLLGTTAAKVANHADRNVLVVHQRTTEATARINPVPPNRT